MRPGGTTSAREPLARRTPGCDVAPQLLRIESLGPDRVLVQRGQFTRLAEQPRNVLLRTSDTDARRLEARIDAMLSAEYGLKGKTVVRRLTGH